MDQYAIFCLRNPSTYSPDVRNPIGVAILSDQKVTLTGPQGFIKQWGGYFQTRGWQRHLENKEPFVSMKQKSSMASFVAYKSGDGKQQYEAALAALGPDVKTKEITPIEP